MTITQINSEGDLTRYLTDTGIVVYLDSWSYAYGTLRRDDTGEVFACVMSLTIITLDGSHHKLESHHHKIASK